jgi:hypothetical protein
LIDELKDLELGKDDTLVSFDAVSLFTCIPVSLVTEVISDSWSSIQPYTTITKEMFLKALCFCLRKGYCKFDGKCYAQTEGVAMGSPLSPIVAEMVLDRLFRTIKEKFDVIYMCKYVDDSLFIVNKNLVNDILKFMNSFHPRLTFTQEIEKDSSINFLDVTIFKNGNGTLSYKHYKKPSYTGRIINYYSNQPPHFKRNTARGLLRSWLSVSHEIFHEEVKKEFRKVLQNNHYPPNFIRLIMNSASPPSVNSKSPNPSLNNINVDSTNPPPSPSPNNVNDSIAPINVNSKRKKERFFSIPYIGTPSVMIKRHLEKLHSRCRITFSCYNQNKKIFTKLKDRIPPKKAPV